MSSSATVTDQSSLDKRPGLPRPPGDVRPSFAPGPKKKAPPPSPWTAHLRALVGHSCTVFTYGPAALLEFEGRLVAVDFNHLNCAIETDKGLVLTFKNVHHISSLAPVGGYKLPAIQAVGA